MPPQDYAHRRRNQVKPRGGAGRRFFTLRGGRILEHRAFFDSFDLVQQLPGQDLAPALAPSVRDAMPQRVDRIRFAPRNDASISAPPNHVCFIAPAMLNHAAPRPYYPITGLKDGRKHTMKIALLVLLGLVLGAVGGAVLGVAAGLAWVALFNTTSFEGYSGMLVFLTFMPLGAAIGGLGGALLFAVIALRDGEIAIEQQRARRRHR